MARRGPEGGKEAKGRKGGLDSSRDLARPKIRIERYRGVCPAMYGTSSLRRPLHLKAPLPAKERPAHAQSLLSLPTAAAVSFPSSALVMVVAAAGIGPGAVDVEVGCGTAAAFASSGLGRCDETQLMM